MQEILKHLSQQDEKNKESQQVLGQHLNNEAQKQNCLIEQLRQLVAEREAKVKELEEEIGQLTLQVVREMNQRSTLVRILDLFFHFLLQYCPRWLLADATNTCPTDSLFCPLL